MADSLGDILQKRKTSLPVDAAEVRDFILGKLQMQSQVSSTAKTVIIYAPNASAAANLRPYLHIISRDLKITKKILLRVSQ